LSNTETWEEGGRVLGGAEGKKKQKAIVGVELKKGTMGVAGNQCVQHRKTRKGTEGKKKSTRARGQKWLRETGKGKFETVRNKGSSKSLM